MANAQKVTDAPGAPPLKRPADTPTLKPEPETKAKTTTGTKKPAAGKAPPPSDADVVARVEADPLRQALAEGKDLPALELPALHPDRTSATIPPDFTWASGVTEWPHAMQRYWEARNAAPGREVGVWHNAADGSYAVTIGTGTGVNPPPAGDWVGVLHYHPNPDNTTRFQMPAPHDFAEMMMRFQRGDGKQSVREFVDYGGPGQRQGRTEFGITAGDPMPFYVTTATPGGEKVTLRFKDDGHFRQEWGGQEIYVGKEIADAMKRDLDVWLANTRQQRALLEPPTAPASGKSTAQTGAGKGAKEGEVITTTGDTGTVEPGATPQQAPAKEFAAKEPPATEPTAREPASDPGRVGKRTPELEQQGSVTEAATAEGSLKTQSEERVKTLKKEQNDNQSRIDQLNNQIEAKRKKSLKIRQEETNAREKGRPTKEGQTLIEQLTTSADKKQIAQAEKSGWSEAKIQEWVLSEKAKEIEADIRRLELETEGPRTRNSAIERDIKKLEGIIPSRRRPEARTKRYLPILVRDVLKPIT